MLPGFSPNEFLWLDMAQPSLSIPIKRNGSGGVYINPYCYRAILSYFFIESEQGEQAKSVVGVISGNIYQTMRWKVIYFYFFYQDLHLFRKPRFITTQYYHIIYSHVLPSDCKLKIWINLLFMHSVHSEHNMIKNISLWTDVLVNLPLLKIIPAFKLFSLNTQDVLILITSASLNPEVYTVRMFY